MSILFNCCSKLRSFLIKVNLFFLLFEYVFIENVCNIDISSSKSSSSSVLLKLSLIEITFVPYLENKSCIVLKEVQHNLSLFVINIVPILYLRTSFNNTLNSFLSFLSNDIPVEISLYRNITN